MSETETAGLVAPRAILAPESAEETNPRYQMRISRLTLDKLGIKLYDRVAAVLAELIANAYDADAETVTITLPFGRYLAAREDGKIVDRGYTLTIQDDGHGMTTDEANRFYLLVGNDRRRERGRTTSKGRRVMGRKGIGKLAPFGICRTVEVISAGGKLSDGGYQVAHFILELENMMEAKHDAYEPRVGDRDGTIAEKRGTTIILRDFERRYVPDKDDLHRQLAARFGITRSDWSVLVKDTESKEQFTMGELPIEEMPGTRVDVSGKPVVLEDGAELSVKGWIAYSRQPYRDEAMAGVRIFASDKIVAQTRDFELGTGFTGEFKMRSYVVGEVRAEWLDEDEDLIRSDRQDIIWNSERGQALRSWGQEILKSIAATAESSARTKLWEDFKESSKIEATVRERYTKDVAMRENVLSIARLMIERSDPEIIRDPDFCRRIVELALSIAPHRALINALHEVATGAANTLDAILDLFNKARLAEIYALGQVAQERVDSVAQLRRLINDPKTLEEPLQLLIEEAPWLLYPDWTPLAANTSLQRVRTLFEDWYEQKYGVRLVTTAIRDPRREPDFILLSNEGLLEIVEIKKPNYSLTDAELSRAYRYLLALDSFFEENREIGGAFTEIRLRIVCDGESYSEPTSYAVFRDQRVKRISWNVVLNSTTKAHEEFIEKVKQAG